jgi:DNA excision repair protein ERCC-3
MRVMHVQSEGYIASVKCFEVWCEMTPLFYREYLKDDYHVGIQRVCRHALSVQRVLFSLFYMRSVLGLDVCMHTLYL